MPRYKKKANTGTTYIGKEKYSPGDIYNGPLPESFLDQWDTMEAPKPKRTRKKVENIAPVSKDSFVLKETSGGMFDIVNTVTSKSVNDQPLSKAEAEAFVAKEEAK